MATKKKSAPKEKVKKGPKQSALPGMEDRSLEELESKAEEYAETRDERMKLTTAEGELNDELLALMKKHKKVEYHHGDVHCWVQSIDEKVKVKIGDLPAKKTTQKATDFTPPEDFAPPEPDAAPAPEVQTETEDQPEPVVMQ
jgi:hypothetical protein